MVIIKNVGRWQTIDPARQYWSPYLGMGNNPVMMVDRDGRVTDPYTVILLGFKEAIKSGIVELISQRINNSIVKNVNPNSDPNINYINAVWKFSWGFVKGASKAALDISGISSYKKIFDEISDIMDVTAGSILSMNNYINNYENNNNTKPEAYKQLAVLGANFLTRYAFKQIDAKKFAKSELESVKSQITNELIITLTDIFQSTVLKTTIDLIHSALGGGNLNVETKYISTYRGDGKLINIKK
jgi:hypothetical protein